MPDFRMCWEAFVSVLMERVLSLGGLSLRTISILSYSAEFSDTLLKIISSSNLGESPVICSIACVLYLSFNH